MHTENGEGEFGPRCRVSSPLTPAPSSTCDTLTLRTRCRERNPDSALDPEHVRARLLHTRNRTPDSINIDGCAQQPSWSRSPAAPLLRNACGVAASLLRHVMTSWRPVRVNRVASVVFILLTAASMLHSSSADPDLLKVRNPHTHIHTHARTLTHIRTRT